MTGVLTTGKLHSQVPREKPGGHKGRSGDAATGPGTGKVARKPPEAGAGHRGQIVQGPADPAGTSISGPPELGHDSFLLFGGRGLGFFVTVALVNEYSAAARLLSKHSVW